MQITDYTELQRFEAELRDWYTEAEKQKNEFTITENDLNADRRSGLVPDTAIAILKPPEQGQMARFKVHYVRSAQLAFSSVQVSRSLLVVALRFGSVFVNASMCVT